MSIERGLGETLRRISRVETERPRLQSHQHLITVDGVDGSGKSVIARLLSEEISRRLGEDRVLLVQSTNIAGSPKQDRLRSRMDECARSASRENLFYAAGVNRAYDELIIPALKAGKIVVVDRSELDLLRFAIESGDHEEITRRERYLSDGAMTQRYWAGRRIFVDVSAEDVWSNLQDRGKLSSYDPHSLPEVVVRQVAQARAELVVEKMPHDGTTDIMRFRNQRIEGKDQREFLLRQKVRELADRIRVDAKDF